MRRGRSELSFWKRKSLGDLSHREWELLCDGCGKCCLLKLEDPSGEVSYTNVACRLLNRTTCRCTNYEERKRFVPDCIALTQGNLGRLSWMPSTCAYRLLAEGRDLYWWHHLVSGSRRTVHESGVSVRGKTVDEREAGALDDHVVRWPA